ncbi:L,D-transpeptidase family protein [Dactylosporangium aurantiacum]|uniref:L,D-transpeptidase family protein n=1 Tax=Dactylosporangium aurantiacum TaxID=35754 RepID=A0A9Q9ILC3_9ACTN|nr:Ig-like domain-containing protein [Dactylosporangium aurantiacum]MDG6103269.1 Ig-like domain-containing protein [Dactylosporangium aurantiacum]UWZ57771.1 L,D-transpeptidase family protein [Dactylosporangium aurantiacum]
MTDTPPSRTPVRRRVRPAVALTVAAALLLTACTDKPAAKDPGAAQGTPTASPAAPALPVELAISSPANGAANVPTALDLGYTATNAADVTVKLTDAAGAEVAGAARADGKGWQPAAQLKYSTKYTATVTATATDGKPTTATTTFTTMAKPGKLGKVTSIINDKQVVGVGMPVIITFGVDVAKEQRAAVQQRIQVTSDPPQEGAFNWFTGKELHFRPKEYWQPGTKLTVNARTGGTNLDGKWWGERDVAFTATVGPKFVMEVDNATKQMTVTQDGQLLRTIPVSLGRPKNPSASGNFIIMIKNEWEWFDSSTYGVPADSDAGYRTKVYWPQRLTWDGEYIHSAPWSEGDQGKRNVSHGCTNISAAHAEWLWKQTRIGDPVIIKGTEEQVKWGNGWTDWSTSWDQYVKGSAVPYVPATTSASASPSPSPSAS